LRGEALTPASDVFSLGVVLYEALAGRLPFAGRTPEQVSAAHAKGAPRPPSAFTDDAPGRLDDAILQALRPDSASRFLSADAMARALQAAADELAPALSADETQVVRLPSRHGEAQPGYVPPPAQAAPRPPPRVVPPRGAPPRRSGVVGLVGTLLVLGAAALVIAFVVLRLLDLASDPRSSGGPSPSGPSASAVPGTVLVPQTVGLATRDAMDLATSAGLDWTVACSQDPSQPEGIVDQEPPAGIPVAPESTFTMYSARISDCR